MKKALHFDPSSRALITSAARGNSLHLSVLPKHGFVHKCKQGSFQTFRQLPQYPTATPFQLIHFLLFQPELPESHCLSLPGTPMNFMDQTNPPRCSSERLPGFSAPTFGPLAQLWSPSQSCLVAKHHRAKGQPWLWVADAKQEGPTAKKPFLEASCPQLSPWCMSSCAGRQRNYTTRKCYDG